MQDFIQNYVYQKSVLCKPVDIIKNCKLDVCQKIIGQIAIFNKLA